MILFERISEQIIHILDILELLMVSTSALNLTMKEPHIFYKRILKDPLTYFAKYFLYVEKKDCPDMFTSFSPIWG